jgi:acyl-homoserine lactone acylase PvdQ
MYDGFAAGVNRYIELHSEEFPEGMPADFSGYDVATLHIGNGPPAARVRRFVAALNGEAEREDMEPPGDDIGSNAWALAPSRTKSGRAILLRNPHLTWTAGYYEAHLAVPGVVDFYGDFRIGGPLIVIGGFNRDLGWATTNSNSGDLTEIYALDADPEVRAGTCSTAHRCRSRAHRSPWNSSMENASRVRHASSSPSPLDGSCTASAARSTSPGPPAMGSSAPASSS